MKIPAQQPDLPQDAAELETDSLTTGLAYMMLLTVAQRAVGFGRTALFCRLLPEEELGQWSLVFSFVMLFAPLTVMGITGSFGRYVEHYFQIGELRRFLRRTGMAVMGLACLITVVIWLGQQWFAEAIFGSVDQAPLLLPACITLLVTIAYNYFLETVIALRRVRVGSTMELISSWTFAFLGVAFLWLTDLGSYGVILSFAIGNLLATAYAATIVFLIWSKLPQATEGARLTNAVLWQKVAPFAVGVWLVNCVSNAFEMVDRYMIVHFSDASATAAQGLVGQYFSSMAVPLLMVGVVSTIAHLVMPYLSQDWEAGRRDDVSTKVNLSFKLSGIVTSGGSVTIMLLSPIIFNVVFGGKYDQGLAVLPWTITFCCWRGLSVFLFNYLMCVEKTKLTTWAYVVGLGANIGLNAMFLPIFGLMGAALATALSEALALGIMFAFSLRHGFKTNWGMLWVVLFPLVLWLGPMPSAIAFTLLVWVAGCTSWLFSPAERQLVEETVYPMVQKALPDRWQGYLSAPTSI